MSRSWRRLVHVGGRLTELYGWDAVAAPQLQICIVPGNPGNAAFYVEFANMLSDALGGAVDITAIGHAGHDAHTAEHHAGDLLSLDEQIAHKVAYLRNHLMLPGRPPVVLLGHSIGTYIALHAARRVEQEQQLHDQQPSGHQQQQQPRSAAGDAAAKAGEQSLLLQNALSTQSPPVQLPEMHAIVGMCPFLATNPSCRRQRLIAKAAEWRAAVAATASALACLPAACQKAMIRCCSNDLDDPAVDVVRSLLHRHSVHNNFYMAHTEFRDLDRSRHEELIDIGLLRHFGQRLALICTDNDMWFPERHFRYVTSQLPEMRAIWDKALTHAFCVSAVQSRNMAGHVASCLAERGAIGTARDSAIRAPDQIVVSKL